MDLPSTEANIAPLTSKRGGMVSFFKGTTLEVIKTLFNTSFAYFCPWNLENSVFTILEIVSKKTSSAIGSANGTANYLLQKAAPCIDIIRDLSFLSLKV